MSLFSDIQIFINKMNLAVLGVLSLSLFLCESRIKEIGIRKIKGAKVWEVILDLNKVFAINLFIAYIISCPLAWFIMRKWLDNFAYKTTISPGFLLVQDSLYLHLLCEMNNVH